MGLFYVKNEKPLRNIGPAAYHLTLLVLLFLFILIGVWSRWWWCGDCCGQRRLYGWVLFWGKCCYGCMHALSVIVLLHLHSRGPACSKMVWFACVCHLPCVLVLQIEVIRNNIDKIDENVTEVKKLYSVILSAPTSDQSKKSPPALTFTSFFLRYKITQHWSGKASALKICTMLYPAQKHRRTWRRSPMT